MWCLSDFCPSSAGSPPGCLGCRPQLVRQWCMFSTRCYAAAPQARTSIQGWLIHTWYVSSIYYICQYHSCWCPVGTVWQGMSRYDLDVAHCIRRSMSFVTRIIPDYVVSVPPQHLTGQAPAPGGDLTFSTPNLSRHVWENCWVLQCLSHDQGETYVCFDACLWAEHGPAVLICGISDSFDSQSVLNTFDYIQFWLSVMTAFWWLMPCKIN